MQKDAICHIQSKSSVVMTTATLSLIQFCLYSLLYCFRSVTSWV